jgi:hypothetical protein
MYSDIVAFLFVLAENRRLSPLCYHRGAKKITTSDI